MKLEHFSQTKLPTKYGSFDFHVFRTEQMEDICVLTLGQLHQNDEPIFTRIHSACATSEIFGSLKCDCNLQLEGALKTIQNIGKGVLIYLNQEGRGIGIGNKIKAYALQERGHDTVEANEILGFDVDLRTYEAAVGVLNYFKVKDVQLNTNSPAKIKAMEGAGFKVSRAESVVELHDESRDYIKTKIKKCGHLL